MRISELARELGAEVDLSGASDVELTDISTLDRAGPTELSFLTNLAYESALKATKAAAVIVPQRFAGCRAVQLVHMNPHYAMARAAQRFDHPYREHTGVSPQAYVAPTARLAAGVTVYPFAYVGAEAELAAGVTIYPHAYVGPRCRIGADSVIRPHAVLELGTVLGERVVVSAGAVVGADGFGFAVGERDIAKVPQRGHVVLGDDVEIGSLSNVHRGALAATTIGAGTKLDSLVHVAHNVTIGEHCMLCGQTGIAGSAKIGSWVVTAGQTAINGHITVGDRVLLGARGVIDNTQLEAGSYHGFPAQPSRQHWKEQALIRRLPKLQEELRELREQVARLNERLGTERG